MRVVAPVQVAAFSNLARVRIETDDGLETDRAYTRGFCREIVTELPTIEGGDALPMPAPGLGTALREELRERPDVRRSEAAGR